jgi:hypothetical protein
VDYSAVYDYNYYVNKYPDIKKAFGYDDSAVLAHFVKHGINEGRQAKATFNLQSYKNRYSDLRKAYGSNNAKYVLHYIKYGQKEGRVATGYETTVVGATTVYNGVDYSAVYDYNYYVNKYADIKKAYGYNDSAVLAHFVKYGMKEGRQAKATFNVTVYRNNYADLRMVYGNNLKAYYLHFIKHGKREGRTAI